MSQVSVCQGRPILYQLPTGTTCLTQRQDLTIKVASPVGTLIGQLLFGWFADIVGRKCMYGVELCIIVVTTFFQAIAGHRHTVSSISALVICHFLMGIGIGSDHPLVHLSPTNLLQRGCKFAAMRTRGRLMTGVFSLQAWGQFTAIVVSTIIIIAFKKNDNPSDPTHVDFICPTPGSLSFETWDNAKILVGAAYSWFALDSSPQQQSIVLTTVAPQQDGSAIYQNLFNISKSFAILYRQPVPAQVIALATIVIHNAVTQWRETGELKNMSLEDKNGYCAKYRKILEHLDIVQRVMTTA
ncbi:hypothetical protein BU17DRAFT_61202 [Hysterangium stoloniferum]|nr:hypothetical protein BU17DRAFT_61202 [Hysterangium stoloniferum]